MNRFFLIKHNNGESADSFFNNANRLFRIFYRAKSYSHIFGAALRKGVSLKKLLIAQFPFAFPDSTEPPIVSIEFTTHCNLKCCYCTNASGMREKGHMRDVVFNKIIHDLSKMKRCRIQLVGNGEATLHPRFYEYIRLLGKTNHYISLVTNGQWLNKKVADQLLEAKVDMIEISVDAGGKDVYETSRINGSYERLINNVKYLKERKVALNSRTLINIRIMLRPSQLHEAANEKVFWKKYADMVMPQYLNKINNTDYSHDLFIPHQQHTGAYPKCSMPFKHIEVKYTGEVLLCYYSFYQLGSPGLVLGNIMDSSIVGLWNSETMKLYRNAQRNRQAEHMPVCKGCPGT